MLPLAWDRLRQGTSDDHHSVNVLSLSKILLDGGDPLGLYMLRSNVRQSARDTLKAAGPVYKGKKETCIGV